MRINKYILIIAISLCLPVPLFLVFGAVCYPINYLLFYVSIDDKMRWMMADLFGITLSRSNEVIFGVFLDELQFLIIGLLICLFVALKSRKTTNNTIK